MSVPGAEVNARDLAADAALYRQHFRRYLRELEWAHEWRSAACTSAEDGLNFDADRAVAAARCRLEPVRLARGSPGPRWRRNPPCRLLRGTRPRYVAHPAQQWTLETLGPALIRFAPALAAQHLPHYLDGSQWWGHPSLTRSGSDRPACARGPSRDGSGGFVVNGQKIWTSQGPTAKRLVTLVRTGTPESRHRGLTMLMIDAESPGVTVRPIALASGRRELAEVFFDDVRLPAERIVGEVGGGWAVRSPHAVRTRHVRIRRTEQGVDGTGQAARRDGGTRHVRRRPRVVRAGLHRRRMRARSNRGHRAQARRTGRPSGRRSSIDKLLFGTAEKAANDLVLDLRRDWMIAGIGSASAAELDTVRADWWYSRAATVMGGAVEVQRGIIADHLLGLPKEKR